MLSADLYQRIREQNDLENTDFLTDLWLGQKAEEQYFELWDLLCDTLKEEMPFEIATFTTTASQAFVDVAITAGVYRILRFDAALGDGDYVPLWRGNLATDVMGVSAQEWRNPNRVRYYGRRGSRGAHAARVSSADSFAPWRFYFDPIPSGVYTGRLWYVPPPAILIATASPLAYTSFPDEWPEYVIAGVSALVAVKQEADPTPFMSEKAAVASRIRLTSGTQQLQQPQSIADHRQFQTSDIKNPFYDRRP